MSEVKLQEIKLKDIVLLEKNPRTVTEADLKKLSEDISEDPNFLSQRPPLINYKNGKFYCYAGTQRVKACRLLGKKKVICFVEENVSEKLQDERMIKDNLHRGKWDYDKLHELDFDLPELEDFGFDDFDLVLDAAGEKESDPYADYEKTKNALQEKFLIPPFSILDTKQGYWQDRKRSWHNIGIKSDEGRDTGLQNSMNNLLEKNNQSNASTNSGDSVFDPVLAEICYKWFCVDKGKVLDPFAGGSVRGVVASYLGFQYTGIDLSKTQIEENKKQAKEIRDLKMPNWINENSLDLDKVLPKEEEFDFVFSCPPYHDLEVYSEDKRDLSNLDYEDFLKAYSEIIKKAVAKLKDNRFACFVVSEIRNKKGLYKNFVQDTINSFTEAGAEYYNEMILVNVAGSLPMRITKQFNSGRKIGRMHQNVLVFYKGDPKKIKEEYGKVDIKLDLEE